MENQSQPPPLPDLSLPPKLTPGLKTETAGKASAPTPKWVSLCSVIGGVPFLLGAFTVAAAAFGMVTGDPQLGSIGSPIAQSFSDIFGGLWTRGAAFFALGATFIVCSAPFLIPAILWHLSSRRKQAHDTEGATPVVWEGKWLLWLGIGSVFCCVCPIVGLALNKRFRPFTKAAKIGYVLCWIFLFWNIIAVLVGIIGATFGSSSGH